MKKGEKRKQELLMIAYRMFLTCGYENTSVDEIINEAGIAKGTFYYYFGSKEQMLEEVIGMMIEKEAESARQILSSDAPVLLRIAGIISSIRPEKEELPIEDALNRPENVLMHKKIKQRLLDTVVPMLAEAVKEGVDEGIFDCEDIPERVRMLLILSSELFDEEGYTKKDIAVFTDLTEKLLGAPKGSLGFISELVERGSHK